jgi:hypothetical protein
MYLSQYFLRILSCDEQRYKHHHSLRSVYNNCLQGNICQYETYQARADVNDAPQNTKYEENQNIENLQSHQFYLIILGCFAGKFAGHLLQKVHINSDILLL